MGQAVVGWLSYADVEQLLHSRTSLHVKDIPQTQVSSKDNFTWINFHLYCEAYSNNLSLHSRVVTETSVVIMTGMWGVLKEDWTSLWMRMIGGYRQRCSHRNYHNYV